MVKSFQHPSMFQYKFISKNYVGLVQYYEIWMVFSVIFLENQKLILILSYESITNPILPYLTKIYRK